jgi:hypothetical protein
MRLPSVRNILALRRTGSGDVNEAYVYFCENFLKYVVGVSRFNREYRSGNGILSMATISDEAFALLQLENSETRWAAEFAFKNKGQEISQKDLPQPLYTSGGSNNKSEQRGFTKKHGGWSEDGIKRFNDIYKLIDKDRETNGKWFDERLRERMMKSGELDGNVNKSEREAVTACDDMVYPTTANKKPAASLEEVEVDETEEESDESDNEEDEVGERHEV